MYKIATDGGSRGNGDGKGTAAWAFVVYDSNENRLGSKSGGFPKEALATNNMVEGIAILEALKWLEGKTDKQALIMSDSSYMVQSVNTWMNGWAANGWTKKSKGEIKNLSIMKAIYELKPKVNFRLMHVKGHQIGNSFEAVSNREADALCNVKMDEEEFEAEVMK